MYSVNDSYETSEAFSSIHRSVNDIISTFKEYILEGSDLAQRKMLVLDEKLKDHSQKGFEELGPFLQHDYEPRRIQNYILDTLFLHSGIGYLYSQLDIILLRIAEATKELFKSNQSIGNYKNKCSKFNKDIIKSKQYLIDTYRLDLKQLDLLWYKIENFKKIRNYFIHQNGIYIKDKKFIEYVDSETSLEIKYDRLVISREYLIEISNNIELILNDLMKIIYDTYKANKHK